MLPESTGSSPAMAFSSVDLPMPDSPTIAMYSPAPTSREISCRTALGPNRLLTRERLSTLESYRRVEQCTIFREEEEQHENELPGRRAGVGARRKRYGVGAAEAQDRLHHHAVRSDRRHRQAHEGLRRDRARPSEQKGGGPRDRGDLRRRPAEAGRRRAGSRGDAE